MSMNEMTVLDGTVLSVTFQNTENGYTVIDFAYDDDIVTAVGILDDVYSGERLRLTGTFEINRTYGEQFKIELCERCIPETAAEILSFLSSGIIKGIREKTAQKIVSRFGSDTLDIIENDFERLSEIKGISKERALEISADFVSRKGEMEVVSRLRGFGFNNSEAMRIYRKLGARSAETVERNPYFLCTLDIGIDFQRADAVASSMEVLPKKEYRICEAVIYVLKYNLNTNGHTCIPREQLKKPCLDLLECSEDEIEIGIDTLIEQKRIIQDTINSRQFIFLTDMYEAEKSSADHILFIQRYAGKAFPDMDSQIKNAELAGGVCYNDRQRLAIKTAVEQGILILTGGPGTGKTTTLRGILRVFEDLGLEVALTAPTGRAAKRMSELTGKEAKTIHRLLEVEWDEDDKPVFQKNARNPLTAEAVIVDELSMVDISLFSNLLDALPIGCRLIMVGDSNQLPPVGAGNVLHDMIDSGKLPVIELNVVFRQAMESLIITNAHMIVEGKMPDLTRTDKDFFFMNRTAPAAASETVCELCSERLPAAYGFSPTDDIQVLCPSRKGETGTENINRMLQAKINPPDKKKDERAFGSRIFRVGDKLMQTKNNYNIEWTSPEKNGTGVFNGDIGILESINKFEDTITVRFDDRTAEIPFEYCRDIEHAYAVTVHKSQGSEFPAVIIPVTGINPFLRYRNLLYTAVTRAKKLIILVGSQDIVREMTENNKKQKRYSSLKNYIMLGDGRLS